MSQGTDAVGHDWERLRRTALVAGLGGLVLCGVVALFSPSRFFRAYLVAYNFWLGVTLGCLVILMLQHLTGGAWGILLRRVLESASRTLLLLVVLFLPLLTGLARLYAWVAPESDAEPLEEFKREYLNVPAFLARAAVYFAIWLTLSRFLNKWSTRQDSRGAPAGKLQPFSALGLVLYGATITFAAVDWVMSLEPDWYSTIYPLLFAVGQLLGGVSFAVAVVLLLATRPPLADVIRPQHMRDLGNLLLLFVMFWAYLSFSQFLLIWAENLPEEIPWYVRRMQGGWEWVGVLLLAFQFGVPFLLLLFREVKHSPRALGIVAVLVLAMHFLDLVWWVEPAFGGVSLYVFLDVAALIGVGGIWTWWFLGQLTQRPLLPGPLPEALAHESGT